MTAARKLILIVCVVAMLLQGCAGNLRCLLDDGRGHQTSLVAQGDEGGLQQTRHGEARALLWAAVGIIIVGAFIVDLFILPYSCYSRHHYFPCCTGLIRWCH